MIDENALRLQIGVDGLASVQGAMGAAAASVKELGVATEVASAEGGEALTLLREKFLAVAEGAGIASAEVGSSFGMLGALLGAGIAFEFLNHLKESTLQIGHLAEATGISVESLVELKDSMAALGASTDRLPMQLTKLAQSIAAAANGGKEAQHNFHQLGVETDGWAKQLPGTIDVLLQMAHHLQESGRNTSDLAAASRLLGRNTFETIAFLKQGDEAIRQQMKSHEEHARAVRESVESAKELQRTEAALSQELQTALLPAFRVVVTGIEMFIAGLIKIKGAGDATIAFVSHLGDAFGAVGKLIGVALSPENIMHPERLVAAVAEMRGTVTKALQDGASEWGQILSKADKDADDLFKPVEIEAKAVNDEVVKDTEKAAKSRLDVWRETLIEMKLQEDAFHDSGAAGDLKYWEDIKAHNVLGKNEILAINNEIYRARKQVAKDSLQDQLDQLDIEIAEDKKNLALKVEKLKQEAELFKQTYGEKSHEYQKAVVRVKEAQQEENDDIDRKLKEQKRKYQELGAAKAAAAVQGAQDTLNEQNATLDYEVTIGKISASQKITLQKEYEAQAYASEYAALTQKIALYAKDTKEYENAVKERDKLDANYHTRQIALERQSAIQRLQPMMQFFSQVGQNFKTSLNGWLQGTQTLGQALKNMWNGIALAAIESIEGIAMKWIQQHILMKAISAIFHLEDAAQSATTDAAKVASAVASNTAIITSDAAVAAAAAFASTAAIPITGPLLAPEAALAAYSAVMAMVPAAAFEGGGIIPKTGFVLAHESEGVVNAKWTKQIMDMASPDNRPQGNDVHLHDHTNIQAIDQSGMEAILRKHRKVMVGEFKAAVRDGKIGLKS